MLMTKKIQIEVIELYGEVNSLGFHIFGGKSTGVAVQAIIAHGTAHRDGRLRQDDHIVQINKSNVRGLGSEHVAAVLRLQKGPSVSFVIARSVGKDLPPTREDAIVIPTVDLDEYLEENFASESDSDSESKSTKSGETSDHVNELENEERSRRRRNKRRIAQRMDSEPLELR